MAGVAGGMMCGVVGGSDGGTSLTGEPRDGESAGLAAEDVKGVLVFLDEGAERGEEEEGSGYSLVGLAAVGEVGEP